MNRLVAVLVVCIVVLSAILGCLYWSPQPSYDTQKDSAINYLKGHFNESLGLLYESEDAGTRVVNGTAYRGNQTYFIYSDNLLAEWALKPYDPEMSDRINQSIASYYQPSSKFFEVLFGSKIPINMSCAEQPPIWQDSDSLVIAEIHDSTTPLAWQNYGDSLIYQSLNYYLAGDWPAANDTFFQAYHMWDDKGIRDASVEPNKPDAHYSNYKLALVLYASKVLNIPIKDYSEIEAKLWSMQQQNGGVTSWADLNGNQMGTANTETTAIALLPYDNQLIVNMKSYH
ncbi:MAG: hypothetical protein ACM3UN_00975 [Bacillota bacterium]